MTLFFITWMPIISGVASTVIAGIDLYFARFRKVNAFADLKNELEKISKSNKNAQKGKLITDWLAHGELILGPLKERIVTRFVYVLLTIVGMSLAAFVSEKYTGAKGDEITTFILPVMQVLVVVVPNRVIRSEEKIFLKNLMALHRGFYENYTVPAIRRFNDEMKDVAPLKELVEFYEVEERETWKAIQSLISTNPKLQLRSKEKGDSST
jgi:hypothetical protein